MEDTSHGKPLMCLMQPQVGVSSCRSKNGRCALSLLGFMQWNDFNCCSIFYLTFLIIPMLYRSSTLVVCVQLGLDSWRWKRLTEELWHHFSLSCISQTLKQYNCSFLFKCVVLCDIRCIWHSSIMKMFSWAESSIYKKVVMQTSNK